MNSGVQKSGGTGAARLPRLTGSAAVLGPSSDGCNRFSLDDADVTIAV